MPYPVNEYGVLVLDKGEYGVLISMDTAYRLKAILCVSSSSLEGEKKEDDVLRWNGDEIVVLSLDAKVLMVKEMLGLS
ncbi:hypothetical protein Tco_1111978 [Tanacetum coccineum]|uniref:Uncharacterized protein n=1 Tax=Tanacetum coccineum TaxID=301880 RepID=A0ABQ5IPJ7_9ASTR